MRFFFLVQLIFIGFASSVLAQENEAIPGLIPRFYSISPASDLEVSPELAHQMALNGEDISLIEPKRGTNIFNSNKSEISHLQLVGDEGVRFHSLLASRLGNVRFTIQAQSGELFNVYLSKKVHNYLLRKNILEKIGYNVPAMQWKSELSLSFDSSIDKTLFIEEMKDELLADVKRWIKSDNGMEITLQDALIIPAKNDIYNLALGLMPSELHRGRRLLRAPYVAISMVDTPESVNLFSWKAGRVVLDQVKLFHTNEIQNTFQTSFEDARWITRRIAKLSKEDLAEVVISAHYPKEVELLLIEKITNRRNDLVKIFQLENEFSDLMVDSTVSFGEVLNNGEVSQEFFDGYSSRFSFGDPESPFSNSELGSFALSRLQSEALRAGISRFNKLIGTNTEEFYLDKLKEIVARDGMFFPTQAVVVPNVSGNVILSRDIITGSYMGTNNKVQLVDNFGFNLDAGAVIGIEGLPTPLSFRAGAGIVFQRMFSHVKPIQSLKKAMKEPYKNMAVPMLIRGIAEKINKLSALDENNEDILIASITSDIKNSLDVGESFIISDSITPNMMAEFGASLSAYMFLDEKLLKVYASFNAASITISRMHIHRKDENTLHIYQDNGQSLRLALSIKLKTYVPILGIQARWHKAKATTEYFPLSLDSREVEVKHLKALRKSLLTLSSAPLKSFMNPHVIKHDLGEFGSTLNFLFFKRNKVSSNHSIEVHHQMGGESIDLYRRYDAKTKGRDYEGYITEAINDILANILEYDYSFAQTQVLNPGFTIGGRAKNKIFVSETDGERIHSEYKRVFNGWSIGSGKLKKYLSELNREFGSEIFDPLTYQNTNLIMLYQLQINMKVENVGMQRFLNLPRASLEYLIANHSQYNRRTREDIRGLARSYKYRLDKIKLNLENYPTFAFKKWHSFLEDFLEVVTIEGFIEGAGKENVVAYGRIEGFRSGDEAGDSPIMSDIYGELPSQIHPSISQEIMGKIGIIEGELLAGWLTERAL
tara:strand:+ start:142043 stop:145027 length:2985 start_codon:yes stop_codon:yes gene_type:complete